MKCHEYRVHGLRVDSVLEFPELLPGSGPPDASIRYGDVPLSLHDPLEQNAFFEAKPGHFLLKLDGIARFLVSEGKQILIDRSPDSRDDEIRLFLLGSALGALLHQRGVLPLHGSAIATEKGAVVFVGGSGNGKSTLAGVFQKRGYSVLADDVSVISFDDRKRAWVLPAYPQINVWEDAAQMLNRETASLPRVRPGVEKYGLRIRESFAQEPVALSSVYVIDLGKEQVGVVEAVRGLRKMQMFVEHTYRPMILGGLGRWRDHFKLAEMAANSAPVRRVMRCPDQPLSQRPADLLEEDFRARPGVAELSTDRSGAGK